MNIRPFYKLPILLASILFISACSNEGSDTPSKTDNVTADIRGSVGDGPIVNAAITIRDNNGIVQETVYSDSQYATYQTEFSLQENQYPLTLMAEGGTDLVTDMEPDFILYSVATNPLADSISNINPHSTFITKIAQQMAGGIVGSNNLADAQEFVLTTLNFGLDAQHVADPIFSEITTNNSAYINKSSEMLGEMIRRTRDTLKSTGASVSGDDVVNAIAADLIDGQLDGLGAEGADKRTAAIANLITGQILLEGLANRLRVNGTVATTLMDNAIRETTRPEATILTGDVMITAEMIGQARDLVNSVASYYPPTEIPTALTDIINELSSLTGSMSPSEFTTLFPTEVSGAFNGIIQDASQASESVLDDINSAVNLRTKPNEPGSLEFNASSYSVNEGDGTIDITINRVGGNQGEVTADYRTGSTGDSADTNDYIAVSWTPLAFADGETSKVITITITQDTLVENNEIFTVRLGNPTGGVTLNDTHTTVTIIDDENTAPTIDGTPATTVAVGSLYQFTPSAADVDNDDLNFLLTTANQPSWISFDTNTGELTGTPQASDVGTSASMVISVTDGTDTTELTAFTITVQAQALPGTLEFGANSYSVNEGDGTIDITVNRVNGSSGEISADYRTYTYDGSADWRSDYTAVRWTPLVFADGETNKIITITITQDTLVEGNEIFAVLLGNPDSIQTAVTIIDDDEFTNSPPTIGGTPATTVVAGNLYQFTPSATDANNDDLSFSLTTANQPGWVSFDTSTGELSGTPQASDVGTSASMVISVTDGTDTAELAPFTITVQTLPGSLEFNASSYSVNEGDGTIDITVNRVDGNQGAVSADYRTGSAGDSADTSDYTAVSWTPLAFADGETSKVITITITQDTLVEGNEIFAVQLGNPTGGVTLNSTQTAVTIIDDDVTNSAPTIGGTPATTVVAGNLYQFTPSAADVDNDDLSFSLTTTNQPGWISFDTNTGELTGTPQASDVGTSASMVISVTDGTDTAELAAFTITVQTLPGSLEFNASSYSVNEGDGTIDITVNRVDGSHGEVSADYRTGSAGDSADASDYTAVSWTPLAFADGETSKVITITITQDTLVEDDEIFAVQLGNPTGGVTLNSTQTTVTIIDDDDELPNSAPTIDGTPATTVSVGNLYQFTPNAADVDNDDLSFSLTTTNQPSWISFDTNTGELTGTPQASDVGTSASMVISVTDGTDTAELAAFTITVYGVATGSINLSWVAPSTRTDQTALLLSEIAGYRIYHGDSSNSLNVVKTITNSSTTQHMLNALQPGTHYVAITTYDTYGTESEKSAVQSKVIQ